MTLPNDIARCSGVGSDEEGWREGCETCLRRLAKGGEYHMEPPPIIAFWCEYQIEYASDPACEVPSFYKQNVKADASK